MIPLSLIHNISLLASLSLLSGLLMRWFQRRGLRYSLLTGLLYGAATVVGMATPVVHQPGLIFDGRSIVLGIAGLFGGPLVAAVAALMAGVYRLHLGGAGALMGTLVILESALLGVGGYYLRQHWKGMTHVLSLLGLGGLIHLIMLFLMTLLPGGLPLEVARRFGPTVLLVYPVGFALVGLAFLELERHFRMEAALRESEQRSRTIFERGTDGIIMFSPEGRILDVNDAFARMHGYTRAEMQAFSLGDVDTPESTREAPERMRRLLAGEALKVELEQVHKDGHAYQVEATASRVILGDQPVILSFHRDITERKQAEEALRESEAKLQMLLNSTAEGIYGIDVEGRCTFCNPACLRLTGFTSPEQLLGRNMHHLIHHSREDGSAAPVDSCRIFRAFREGSGTHADDEVFWRADGTCFPAEYWSYPQRRGPEIVGSVVTFIDITERRQAEAEHQALQQQLNQTQKLESLGSLAGGVAHDMNNVLGAILGLASASVENQPPGSAPRQAFQTIIKAAERGGKMVQGLLSFTRQTAAEERELHLNDLLQDEVRLLERTTLSRVRIVMDLADDLRPILGDASALTHAFMNLCVNAVDAMPEPGTLTLRTRNLDGDWIEAQVEDTGTGMPRGVLERALDPFFTTKEQGKGTGLGLSLVYNTVKAHRGHLEILSEPGQGTCVKLRFPACAAAVPVGEVQGEPPPGSQAAGIRVLVIDDDELIQVSVGMLLEALGHEVSSAQSGEEALAKLEAGLPSDLVILDMNMPGLGGIETLPRLRALRPRLPVLLATGRADQAALDLLGADPHSDLLSKPFSMEEMRLKVEAVLGEARSS